MAPRNNNGLAQWKKRLETLPKRIIAEIQPALDKSAAEVAALARRFAPVDSGAFLGSIHVEPGELPTQRLVVAGGEATTKEVREGSGVDYDYAKAIEWGTKEMPARRPLDAAERLAEKSHKRRMRRTVNKAIKSHGGGNG